MPSDEVEGNDNSNIESSDNRFHNFKKMINSETNRLISLNDFSGMRDLGRIHSEVLRMHNKFKSELIEMINTAHNKNLTVESIDSNLCTFFDPFFSKYEDDHIGMMKFIKERSRDFFYNKIIYQLSHMHGIYKKDIDGKYPYSKAFQMNFLLKMYVDYYETFPKYLLPFIAEPTSNFTEKELNDTISYFFFNRFHTIIDHPVLPLEEIRKPHSELRNCISHASIIIKDDDFLTYNIPKMEDWIREGIEPKINEVEDTLNFIYCFNRLLIVYATEIDLRLMELAFEDHSDELFKVWIDYFKTYNDGWQMIGKSINGTEIAYSDQ